MKSDIRLYTVLVGLLSSITAIPAIADTRNTAAQFLKAFDASGMPTSRYSAFEVLLLPSLSATQKQQISDIYTKLNDRKIEYSNEAVELFREEAADYPELTTQKFNDSNVAYTRFTKGQYPQFANGRIEVYAEAAEKKATSGASAAPSTTIEEYKNKEAALAGKIETALNNSWGEVKGKLTSAQLQSLSEVRTAWNDSAKNRTQSVTTRSSLPVRSGANSRVVVPTSTNQTSGFDQATYVRLLRRKIRRAWFPIKGSENNRVVLLFHIDRNGTPSNLRLVECTGSQKVIECATKAINDAAPFAKLPATLSNGFDYRMEFNYDFFTGGP